MKRIERKRLLVIAGGLILILILTGTALRSRSVSAQANSPAVVIPAYSAEAALPQSQAVTESRPAGEKIELLDTSPKSPAPAAAPREIDIRPDQIIQAMKAHYDVQQVNTSCLPYRSNDVEIARVLDVYSHDRYRVTILSRNKTIDVNLIGVSGHTQQGKASEARRQAEALVKGKAVLLIRGASDKRGDTFVRYIVTADGLFLNYEVMQYSWPLVSTEEEDGCYSILLNRANQNRDQ
jgi:hypothetical protein